MEELGKTPDFPATFTDVCTSFACRLYQPSGKEKDIDKLRYKMFCKKPKQNDKISPCKDSIMNHNVHFFLIYFVLYNLNQQISYFICLYENSENK